MSAAVAGPTSVPSDRLLDQPKGRGPLWMETPRARRFGAFTTGASGQTAALVIPMCPL